MALNSVRRGCGSKCPEFTVYSDILGWVTWCIAGVPNMSITKILIVGRSHGIKNI